MRSGPRLSTGHYKPVRGLTRGLAVLKALNQAPGGIETIGEVAAACAIHRTTVKRLLETLRSEGFVRHADREGQYYLTCEDFAAVAAPVFAGRRLLAAFDLVFPRSAVARGDLESRFLPELSKLSKLSRAIGRASGPLPSLQRVDAERGTVRQVGPAAAGHLPRQVA